MIASIERNIFEKFAWLPERLGQKVRRTDELMLIDSKLPTSMFNITCNVKTSDSRAQELINEVINEYEGRPFAWWIGPSGTPTHLGDRLSEKGFIKETTEYMKVLDLTQCNPIQPTSHKIEIVDSEEKCHDFGSVLAKYDPIATEYYAKVAQLGFSEKNNLQLFVGYLNHQPVVIGSLFFIDNMVGFFDLLTNEESRGKGFGTAMVNFRLNYAIRRGAKHAFLSASSDESYRINERIGFRTLCTLDCYEYNPFA